MKNLAVLLCTIRICGVGERGESGYTNVCMDIFNLVCGGTTILFVLLIGAAVAFSIYWWRNNRRTRMQQLAQQLQLAYEPTGGAAVEEKLDRFWMADRFFAAQSKNVLRGQFEGVDMILCDFPIRFGGVENSGSPTVALFESDRFGELPAFAIFTKFPLQIVNDMLAPDSYAFADLPELAESRTVHGEDRAAIRPILTPPLIDFLIERPHLHIEGSGNRLLVYRLGNQLAPTKIVPFLEDLRPLITYFADRPWE